MRRAPPLPDPSAFSESTPMKKKKKVSLATAPEPAKCPSTPQRTPSLRRCAPGGRPSVPGALTAALGISSANTPAAPLSLESRAAMLCRTEPRKPSVRFDQFEVLGALGQGTFGDVYRVRWSRDGQQYALKRSKRLGSGSKRVPEVESLKLLGPHPNIVEIKAAWEEDMRLFILCELCDQGSLDAFLSREACGDSLTEETVLHFAADMFAGVRHMHAHGVLHLDLKPSNLLLTSSLQIKIADFGLSFRTQSSAVAAASMSPSLSPAPPQSPANRPLPEEGDSAYMAPELLRDEYGKPADIFSLGMTLYEMVTGYVLPTRGDEWHRLRSGAVTFDEPSTSSAGTSAVADESSLPSSSSQSNLSLASSSVIPCSSSQPASRKYSAALRQMILSMLNPDPSLRPTVEALLHVPIIQAVTSTPLRKSRIHRLLSFNDLPGGSNSSASSSGSSFFSAMSGAQMP